MKVEDIVEVVHHLVGPVTPTGMTSVDTLHLCNLQMLGAVLSSLVFSVQKVSESKDSYEDSVKKLGLEAQKILDGLKEI